MIVTPFEIEISPWKHDGNWDIRMGHIKREGGRNSRMLRVIVMATPWVCPKGRPWRMMYPGPEDDAFFTNRTAAKRAADAALKQYIADVKDGLVNWFRRQYHASKLEIEEFAKQAVSEGAQ